MKRFDSKVNSSDFIGSYDYIGAYKRPDNQLYQNVETGYRVVFEFGNPIDVWNTLPKEERLKIFDNDTSGSN